MRAEVFRAKDGWRFRVVADNGEPMAQSEGYVRRVDAIKSARELIPPGAAIEVEDEEGA